MKIIYYATTLALSFTTFAWVLAKLAHKVRKELIKPETAIFLAICAATAVAVGSFVIALTL